MKLDVGIKERFKGLLGGKAVTRRRLEMLAEELEQRRALGVQEDRPAISAETGERFPSGPPPLPTAVGVGEPDDEPDDDETDEEGLAPRQPASLHLVPPVDGSPDPAPAPVFADPEKQLLYDLLKQQGEFLKELRDERTGKEKAAAIAAGKLPVSGTPAGPVGLTGSAALPQGVWFKSPLGPSVDMKLCGCKECTPFRLTHYFCIVCRSGPHHYKQRYPHYRKMYSAPGSTWGISHELCSPSCYMQYMQVIGVMPGFNDATPRPIPTSGDEPQRPVVAVGSD